MLQDFISSCPLKLRLQRLLLRQRPLSTSPLAAPGRLCTHQLIDWRGGQGRERGRQKRKIGDEDRDTPLFFKLDRRNPSAICNINSKPLFVFSSLNERAPTSLGAHHNAAVFSNPSRENFIVQKGRDTNFFTDSTPNKSKCTAATRQVRL